VEGVGCIAISEVKAKYPTDDSVPSPCPEGSELFSPISMVIYENLKRHFLSVGSKYF